jgi:hypothetical protein
VTIDRARVATVTVLSGTRPPHALAASPEGDDLWIPVDALAGVTGWELTAEGVRHGGRVVRVPDALVRRDHPTTLGRQDQVNATGVAALLGQPVLRDAAHAVWCIGESAAARREALRSLEAPDFTLPDLDGRPHALRDYRGKKVFLVSWASW